MGDDNRRREVGQLEQGAGRELVQQAGADQGSVEFAEPDQPVELSGFTVEAAYLNRFPETGREFLLERPHYDRIATPRGDGGGDADDHACESWRDKYR